MKQLAGLALASWPMHGAAMTLEEAVAAGIGRHPEIAAAASEVRAAKTDVDVAKAGYLPAVSVSGGPQDISPDEWAYEVTAAQMVHDWGQVRSQVRGTRAAQRQRQDEWLVARDEAALDIIETYIDLLLAHRQQEVDLAQIDTLEDFAEMTGLRAQSGYADRSEPDRSGLELARARQRLASDEGLLADATSQFETLVGTAPDALVEPAPRSMMALASGSTDSLIDAAPLYLKAVEDTEHARAQYDETRSSILPRVNLEATALSRAIGGRMQSDAILALRLRMNPVQGLSSFDRIDGARQRVALERQVSSAGELGGLYREQFEVGRRDIIDLITIQREHYDARRSLNEVHLQLIRIQYQIAAQLGRLTDLIELEGAEP